MKIVVKKRKIKGRKIKNLRKEGVLPGVIYGPKKKSLNIELDLGAFENIFRKVGCSKFVDIEVEGESKTLKVLIREVQYEPVSGQVIHVSFFELDFAKPITTAIPIEVRGESGAVKDSIGFLVTPVESLEVRCLPEKLPEKLVVDISSLDAIGDTISISDLELPEGVKLTSDIAENLTLAYIAPPQKEIVEEEKEEEVGEEDEEAGEEGEEGEDATEEEAEDGEGEGEGVEKGKGEKTERETKENKQ